MNKPVHVCLRRLCGMALAAWAILALGAAPALAQGKGAQPAKGKVDPQVRTNMADRVEKLLQDLEQSRSQIPRESFEPQAVVAKVGQDPAKLREWVAQNTVWTPYRGMLRGVRGTLMDRTGNSLDRSLLLAELLRLAGIPVRLARAELTPAVAKTLVDGLAKSRRPAAATAAAADGADADGKRVAEIAAMAWAQDLEDVAQKAAEQTEYVRKLLGDKLAGGDDLAALTGWAQDHWWVQMKQDQSWADVDLLNLPARQPAQTVAIDGSGKVALKDQDCHEIEIRVIVEQWAKGKFKEMQVLRTSRRPADLVGQAVSLRNMPLKMAGNFNEVRDGQNLRKTLAAVTEWMPTLQMGGTNEYQSSFTDTGEVRANVDPGAAGEVGGAVGRGVGGMGGLLGGGEEDEPKKPEGVLTGAWIEYELRQPGRQSQTFRRELLDLPGPGRGGRFQPRLDEAARADRCARLTARVDILAMVGQPSEEFLQHWTLVTVLDGLRPLPGLLRDPKSTSDQLSGTVAEAILRLQAPICRWMQLRREASPSWADIYLARPNILNCRSGVRFAADGKDTYQVQFDVVNNDVTVLPGGDRSPLAMRLAQGLLDSVAEGAAVGKLGATDNPASLAQLARAQQVGWRLIAPSGEGEQGLAGLGEEASRRCRQDLAGGYAVIVPEKPILLAGVPRSAWWRVDVRTGQALGVLDNGLHGTTAGESWAIMMINVLKTTRCIRPFACILRMNLTEFCAYMGYNVGPGLAARAATLKWLWDTIQEMNKQGLFTW